MFPMQKVSKPSRVCNLPQAPGWFQRAAATLRRLQEELAAALVSEQDAGLQGAATGIRDTQATFTATFLFRHSTLSVFKYIILHNTT